MVNSTRNTARYEQILGAYELAQRVAFPLLLGMAGWLATGHLDQETRITRIESSRYTQADARADRDRADNERRGLERLLIKLDTRTEEMLKRLESMATTLKDNR